MRAGSVAGRLAWWGMAGAFAILGTVWAADRMRRWESPRLSPVGFEVLRGPAPPTGGGRGFVLVPINPHCSHCVASWRRLRNSCLRAKRCPDLVVLLVDQDRSPPRAILDSFGAASVWWDRDGTWRQVWGHRVYGERIRFDAAGRYRGTSPPLTGL